MPEYVLVTRPVADAVPVADALREHGFTPFLEPMLKIEPLDVKLPDLSVYQALVFTSANAVRVASSMTQKRNKQVYAVGGHTADIASRLGWPDVKSSQGGVLDLQDFLMRAALKEDLPLLHLSGKDVVGELNVPGYVIQRVAVYKASKINSFSDSFLTRLDQGEMKAVLFFSVRTAENFVSLLQKYGRTDAVSSIKALCISDSVLKSLSDLPWLDVRVSETQDREGMLSLLA